MKAAFSSLQKAKGDTFFKDGVEKVSISSQCKPTISQSHGKRKLRELGSLSKKRHRSWRLQAGRGLETRS